VSEPLIRAVFLLHLAATLGLAGLIWFVQVVHYPLLARVPPSELPHYEQAHTRRTAWLVAPPMLVELVTSLVLLVWRPPGVTLLQASLGVALVGVIWLATQGLQVPCHTRLCHEFDPATLRRLVRTNWLRTGAWSLRVVLVLWMLQTAWC
jgi:hypothetical protein